jgi:hypothetical protein
MPIQWCSKLACDLYSYVCETGIFMKGFIAIVFFLLSASTLLGNPSDTTVTSFEIYLKRKSSDNSFGFNTCSIDRQQIYNVVMERIGKKIKAKNILSLHQPFVLMKFHDVTGRAHHNINHITNDAAQAMAGHQYKYFIKVYGNLNVNHAARLSRKATFTLRVYVFDAEGNMIGKSRSTSRERNLTFHKTSNEEENYPVNEQEFFELVTDAADTLEISI